MNESKRSQHDTAVHGDLVGGDKITVGDIENSKGIAFGRDSTVIINEILSKPLLLVLGGLILIVIVLVVIPTLPELISDEPNILKINLPVDIIDEVGGAWLFDVVIQDENKWFATADGLLLLDDEWQVKPIVAEEWISAVAQDSQNKNEIWFGTIDGKVGHANSLGEFVLFDLPEVEEFSEITAIVSDKTGHVWVAVSDQGIWQINRDGHVIGEKISLPDEFEIDGFAVLNMAEQRVIWAIAGSGLYWWRDDEWKPRFKAEDGIPIEGINQVIVDESSATWFAHANGISRIPYQHPLRRGTMQVENCLFSSNQLPGGIIHDLASGEDWLWLVTSMGIARKQISDSELCDDWHLFKVNTNENDFPDNILSMDIDNETCTVWLIANSGSDAYRLSFEGCKRG